MICFSEPQLEPDEKYWECEPVTKIDMSFNSIKSIPPGIELMKAELVTLIIRSNEINELPMEIFELQKLRILDLSSNKLSNINENIMKLNELREIHVNDNLLTTIPISILQCKSLVVLNAANNRITCIPTGLFNNQDRNSLNENKLKSINLSNNLITTITTLTNSNLNSRNALEIIIQLKYLESLDMHKNSITSNINLHHCPLLSLVDFSENKLSYCCHIVNCPKLARIHLNHNKISHWSAFDSVYTEPSITSASFTVAFD